MEAFFGFGSLLVSVVAIIGLVVNLIRKKKVKKWAITAASSFAIFVVLVSLPTETNTPITVEPSTTEVATETVLEETTTPPVVEETTAPPVIEEKTVPTEYKSALKKAKTYSDTMSMSKIGVYDQLTSEYGEKFSQDAGQYAVDNVKADWKANALKKGQTYQDDMAMSPKAVYDQLVSEYGEKFTAKEAQYAKDNLK
jgi:hypothetical protein